MKQSHRLWARAYAPGLVAFTLFVIFMPTFGNPSFGSLELHKQMISVLIFPAMLWSVYRYSRATASDRGGVSENP